MRVFDSQQKVIWKSGGRLDKKPSRLKPREFIYADIDAKKITKISIIGRRLSGCGFTTIEIRDKKNSTLFSKSFKLPKASSELIFNCNIKGIGLEVLLKRSPSSAGSVCIDRLVLDGHRHNGLKKEAIKKEAINYRDLTNRLIRRVNLAIIVPYSIYGGGEVFIKNIIEKGYPNFNIDVLFLAKNKLQEKLSDQYVNLFYLGGLKKLESHLRKDRYDYVVFYNSKQVYECLKNKKLTKRLNSDIIEIYHSNFLWNDAVASLRHRSCVSKIFKVSDRLAEDITGIESSNKVLIPVGVDPKVFSGEYPWPADVKKGYEKTIGLVARLSPEKNIEYALSLVDRIPEYQLVVVGAGPERSRLDRFVTNRQITNVTFVGHKENPEQYYNFFDAFLLTSKIEGTPLTIVEAMMCGIPVFTMPAGEIEYNYSEVEGVTILTGSVEEDASKIKGFDYSRFDKNNMINFSKNMHGIEGVKKRFFDALSCSGLPESPQNDDSFLLPGVYV